MLTRSFTPHHLADPATRSSARSARGPAPRVEGRHAASRRRPLAPFVVGGALVASLVTFAAPEAAHAFAGPAQGTIPAASRLPAPVTPYRLVPGMHLKLKAPTFVLPVDHYQLTGRFGQISGLWATFHTGLDFAAPEGTPIHSIGAGTVVSTAYDGAFGNKTVVRLDDGTVLWYCHQSAFAVHPGERLATGQLVGYIGSTGNTTGPHLHLEVHPHDGPAVDPQAWLPTVGLHP